jgi:riboflavin biosynthesis pyrimidine reductase
VDTLFPAPGASGQTLAQVLESYEYPPLAGGRWWLRANMVTSVDGAATGPDGRSGVLATPVDKAVFGHLRTLADAVVVGAGTARAENYGPPRIDEPTAAARVSRGQAPRPRLVVVTRSLSLDPGARLFSGPDRVTVVTARSADWNAVERLAQVADVLRAGDDEVDLAEMVGVLADQGLRRLLCEGGPTLLADLVADGLLDELCWTVAPVLTGGDSPRMVSGRSPEPLTGVSLAGMVRDDDGTLLTRWVRA